MLPRMHGRELLSQLRATKITPVLVLTARDTPTDKITNLNLGADDYLTKPFDLEELIARVRALIRRSSNHPSPVMRAGDVELDTSARVVRKQGKHVDLAVKEYAILELLMMHHDKLVTRTM